MTNSYFQRWDVEALRVTVFPTLSEQYDFDVDWWKNTVGAEPEEQILKPKNAEYTVHGKIPDTNFKLTIRALPDRIDWQLSVVRDNEGETDLGVVTLHDAQEIFVELMSKWFNHECPDISRIASGSVIRLLVSSVHDGYVEVDKLLPNVTIDTDNSKDFQYRINRPIEIDGIEGKINRLSTWSVVIARTFMINSQTRSKVLIPEVDKVYCRLELDINTSEDFKDKLVTEKLPEIFTSLINEGNKIADKGDEKVN